MGHREFGTSYSGHRIFGIDNKDKIEDVNDMDERTNFDPPPITDDFENEPPENDMDPKKLTNNQLILNYAMSVLGGHEVKKERKALADEIDCRLTLLDRAREALGELLKPKTLVEHSCGGEHECIVCHKKPYVDFSPENGRCTNPDCPTVKYRALLAEMDAKTEEPK